MNFKTTLTLVALAALAGAYFWFFEREATPRYEADRQAQQVQRLEGDRIFPDDFDPATVTGLTVVRGGQQVIIRKEGERWVQTEPVRFPLNDYRPQQVIDAAVGLRFVSRLRPGERDQPSAAELGFEPARGSVTVHGGDDDRTIHLGRSSAGGRGYVMVGDDPHVYVVEETLHKALLTGQITEWRRRSFDAPRLAQLQRIELTRQGQATRVQRHDGRWFLDASGAERASVEALERLVREAGGFYISEFISDDAEKLGYYGLDEPRATVTLVKATAYGKEVTDADEAAVADEEADEALAASSTSAVNETFTLRIGAPADLQESSHFATWSIGDQPSHVVFTVAKTTFETLTQGIDALRDPRLVLAAAGDLREMTVERAEAGRLHLEKTPDRWDFGRPQPEFGLDQAAARRLIDNLVAARATSYTRDLPDETPAAAVTVSAVGATAAERMAVHGPITTDDEQQYLVVRESETIGYLVPENQLAPLFQPMIAFRDRRLMTIEPDELAGLLIDQPDGTRIQFEREPAPEGSTGAGTWMLAEGQSFEREPLNRLLQALRAVEVEAWEDPPASVEADLQLTLTTQDDLTRRLEIDSSSRRGTLEGVEPTFILPQAFVDRLSAEFRDRLLLRIPIEEIESVTIASPDKALTLRRDLDGRYVDGEGFPVHQASAGGAIDTLSHLRAQRYVPPIEVRPIADDQAVRLTIVRRTGDAVTLRLHADRDIARLEGDDVRAFRLGEDVRQTLMGPLTAPAAETPGIGPEIPGFDSDYITK